MPVAEVAWFKSTAAYQADHTLLNDLVSKLRKLDGFVNAYPGFQVEDPTIAYIVVVWASLEQFAAVPKHESYGEIIASLVSAAEDPSKVEPMIVVETTSAPDAALSAPVTELVNATLKEGAQKEDIAAVFEGLGKTVASKGYHWGPVHGKPDNFVAFVGWDSIEAQTKATENDPAFAELAVKGATLVTPVILHVKFWKA